jgi:hypothetical protein
MPNRKAPACRSGLRQREKDEDGEERFHRSSILALRLTRRRLAIKLHPGESAALKALRRFDREFDPRLMREVFRSLEHKPDAKTGGRKAPIKHAFIHLAADRPRF